MKSYTLNELNALLEEYLAECDDVDKDEVYDTSRGFAEFYAGRFVLWLQHRERGAAP